MSSAQRKHKDDAAKAVAAARAKKADRNKVIVGVVVVAVIAILVIGGVLITRPSGNEQVAQKPISVKTSEFEAKREGGMVVAGKQDAPVTIDVYEDFLCPACGQFEEIYGKKIEDAVKQGQLKVNYHPLPFLNKASNPPGYSQDAANAALCSVDSGKFPSYHSTLFANQPEEGGRGYDNDKLIDIGKQVGINSPEFASCVKQDRYDGELKKQMQEFESNPGLVSPQGKQGTPTVAHNGKYVDFSSDPQWLDKLLQGAGQR